MATMLSQRQRSRPTKQTAGTLAALAVRITKATGFYRGPGARSIAIITFGPVTLTAQDGSTSTFEINIE
ncbi:MULTISPECIES: hypothetical protein [unclassified Streptomyces]|uniref:hypothetical protein n=1 Tax=unclassified Streptomyces TaxID=2593676 RepID=UPI001F47ED45|nr:MULTISPECIES: hypothetical protein [unclassified Streptomyces]